MGFIDEAQNTALEIIGLVLILVGGGGLVISGISPFIGLGLTLTLSTVLISAFLLVIGTICAGYRAIPKLLLQVIEAVRK